MTHKIIFWYIFPDCSIIEAELEPRTPAGSSDDDDEEEDDGRDYEARTNRGNNAGMSIPPDMGRVCSGCKAYVEKALFSKNQWSKAATVSRCNVCVTDGIGGDNVGDGGTHMNNHGRRPSQSGDLESSSHLQMYRMDGMLKDGNNLEEIDIAIAAAQHMDVDDGDDTLVVDIKTPAPPYLSRPRSNFHPPSIQQTLDGAGASGSIDGSTAP
eukprot:gene19526-12310_t